MRILLTGGAGYVGSACLRYLRGLGNEVLAYDNLCRGHRQSVVETELVEGDILDTGKLTATLRSFNAEAVMHFAAYAYVGESTEKPLDYYHNNFSGSLSVLNAMRDSGVERLIFSSTCATYGEPQGLPITEQNTQQPLNPYGRSKLAVEWAIRDYSSAYGIGYTLLRYFNAAGADADGQHGEHHEPETHLIPLVLEEARSNSGELGIFGKDYDTPDGTCIRDYVHVADLASAHWLSLERTLPGQGQAFNVGTGQGYSVLDVIESCRKITGLPIKYRAMDRRAGDPAKLVADAGLLRKQTGWTPKYPDLDAIVSSAWGWMTNHPAGYGN